jgi:hypothetical protein
MKAWPFEDPENVATLTVGKIVKWGAAILMVCHDAEDGSWQFLTGEPSDMEDAMLVALKEIVARDSSVIELADLPLGWCASRKHPGAPWERHLS